MTMTIDLSGQAVETLKKRAEAAGVSEKEYAQRLLERDLEVTSERSVAEELLGPIATLPDEVFQGLPTDGASQHDHYIYGTTKRNDL